MTMSILHRTTGIILVVGAFALAWWLLAVAAGGDVYATAAACLASPIGMIALFGFSLSLVYHLLNGIRHMLWDIGGGFELPAVYRSGYTIAALKVVLPALICFFALRGGACAIRRPRPARRPPVIVRPSHSPPACESAPSPCRTTRLHDHP